MKNLNQIRDLLSIINIELFGNKMWIHAHVDKIHENGRIYLQIVYNATCKDTGVYKEWHGRKFYLSDYMTDDEIVKTAYLAFKLAIEHEVMEAFKINNIVLFNPHVDYKVLLEISHKEIKRKDI